MIETILWWGLGCTLGALVWAFGVFLLPPSRLMTHGSPFRNSVKLLSGLWQKLGSKKKR